MKVPYSVVGQTQPSSQSLAYLQPADTSQIVNSFKGMINAVTGLAEQVDARDKKAKEYDAIQKFSEFQMKWNEESTIMKRDSAPNDSNFRERAETSYDNRMKEFLRGIDPALQDEYQARATEYKKGVLGDVLDFQYKSQDAWYRQGVDNVYKQAQIAVNKDPTKEGLAANIASVDENIDKSDLSVQEKALLKKQIRLGLASEAAKQAIKTGEWGGKRTYSGMKVPEKAAAVKNYLVGTHHFSDLVTAGVLGTIQAESGFRSSVKGDGGISHGFFQFNNERLEGLKQFAEAQGRSANDPQTQIDYFVHELNTTEKSVGAALAAAKTPEEVTIAMLDYERPKEWLDNRGPQSREFRNRLALTRQMLGVQGGGELTADNSIFDAPEFADIPLDARNSIMQDAFNERKAEDAAAQKAANDQYETYINDLKLRVYDGRAGKKEIDEAYTAGQITKYEDIKALDEIYKKRNEDVDLLGRAHDKLASGGIWADTEDDRKSMNALFKEDGGTDLLTKGNKQYVDETLLPRVLQTKDVPTDAAKLLEGMMNSDNMVQAQFAYDTIRRIANAAPSAFGRFSEDAQTQIRAFMASASTGVIPSEELVKRIRGGDTIQEQQASNAFKKEIAKIVDDPKAGAQADKVLQKLVAPWLGSNATTYQGQAGASAFTSWYNQVWQDAYLMTGTKAGADEAAAKMAEANWGISEVGGQRLFMEKIPELVLPQFNGSHDWVTDQGKQKLGLGPNERFQLITDDVTRKSIEQARKGELGPDGKPVQPSWAVIRFSADGIPRMPDVNERLSFEKTPEMHKTEALLKELEIQKYEHENYYREVYKPEVDQARLQRRPVDPEIAKEYEQSVKQYNDTAEMVKVNPFLAAPPVENVGQQGFKSQFLKGKQ